jgi:glycosyltransferase involved in cell wall biosynthesis
MLAELLTALDKQSYRSFEVIVIDDGSRDGSGELARGTTVVGRPVRVIDGAGRGALAARRTGIAQARGPVLAFTDSDCVPDPVWIEKAAGAMADGAEVVNGYTKPMRPLKPMERSMASGTEGLFPTCNVFYRRDIYDRLGGFDAGAAARWRFRLTSRARDTGFGEDTLLAWQAIRSGADVRYVPDALVEHQVFPPHLVDFVSRLAQVAAFPAMTKELPELRGTLMRRRVFLGNYSRVPFYAAALALGLRQRRLAGMAVTWWILLRLGALRQSPHSTTAQLPWLPVEMAVDVATAGALVLGSVTARSLVL